MRRSGRYLLLSLALMLGFFAANPRGNREHVSSEVVHEGGKCEEISSGLYTALRHQTSRRREYPVPLCYDVRLRFHHRRVCSKRHQYHRWIGSEMEATSYTYIVWRLPNVRKVRICRICRIYRISRSTVSCTDYEWFNDWDNYRSFRSCRAWRPGKRDQSSNK